MSGVRIAPSLLSADFADLAAEIKAVEDAGVEILHVDIMDGHFVPNITFGPKIVGAIHSLARSDLFVHLMIEDPEAYLEQFIEAGASCVTFHVEAVEDARRLVEKTKSLKVKAGVAINPETPLKAADRVFDVADLMLVMSVHPGFGGQEFIREVVRKIRILHDLRQSKGYVFDIEVDGGIGVKTAPITAWAGADILAAGASIFKSRSPAAAIRAIAAAAQEGLAKRSNPEAFRID